MSVGILVRRAATGGGGGGVSLTNTAPAATEAIGTAAAVGTSSAAARGDHVHPMAAAGAPVASAVGDTQASGSATTFSRSDHRHAREAFGSVIAQTSYGASAADGTATTVARSDHAHGTPSLTSSAATASAVGDSATAGTATAPARADHVHGREAFGSVTAQTSYGASSSNGSATTVSRSDHAHGTVALSTNTPIADSTAPTAGSGTAAAKDDHTHPRERFTPADHALKTWTYDPALVTNSSTPASGLLHLALVHLSSQQSITNVILTVVTGGSGLTSGQCFAGLWKADGTLVGVTADQSSAWASSGTKTMALAGGPFTCAQGDYYIGLWQVFSSGAAFLRGNTTSGSNVGLSTGSLRYCTSSTSLTTTAPNPFATQTTTATIAFWGALS